MFGVAFRLYQGSGVAGLVALARPCCCRLWVGSVAPRLRPLAVVRLSPKLSERWVEIAIVRGPVGIHIGSSAIGESELVHKRSFGLPVCLKTGISDSIIDLHDFWVTPPPDK